MACSDYLSCYFQGVLSDCSLVTAALAVLETGLERPERQAMSERLD